MRHLLRHAQPAAAALLALLLAVGCGGGAGATAPGMPLAVRPAGVPPSASSHVVVMVMENKEDVEVLGGTQAPYLSALARRYAHATRSHGIRHPSLPNYL